MSSDVKYHSRAWCVIGRDPSCFLCGDEAGSSCSFMLQSLSATAWRSARRRNSTKVCYRGCSRPPLAGIRKAFILRWGAFVCLWFWWFLPASAASCISLKVNLFYHRKPRSNHCSHLIRHMHLPIEFFTRTRLACSRQTSHSTLEIYGSWKVELMFIFYQIAKRNSKWQIWVCLPG